MILLFLSLLFSGNIDWPKMDWRDDSLGTIVDRLEIRHAYSDSTSFQPNFRKLINEYDPSCLVIPSPKNIRLGNMTYNSEYEKVTLLYLLRFEGCRGIKVTKTGNRKLDEYIKFLNF